MPKKNKVTKIQTNAENSENYNALREKITETSKVADTSELKRINAILKRNDYATSREIELADVKPSKWIEEQEFMTRGDTDCKM